MRKISAIAKLSLLIISYLTSQGLMAAQKPRPPSRIRAVAGEYLVKLKAYDGPMNIAAVGEDLGGQVKEVISSLGSETLFVLKRSEIEKPSAVISDLRKHSYVEIAEPNYIYSINPNGPQELNRGREVNIPNDQYFEQLWGLQNNGQKDSAEQKGVSGVDINALDAWKINKGSKDVLVAIIDTGIDYKIPDLSPNMWVNELEAKGQPQVDDDGNGYVDDIYGYDFVNNDGDPVDDHGHGSHCAGTIGASGNDNQGVVGVNWQVRLMALKFLSAEGSGSLEDAVKAINYAILMGVDVMSNSWAGGGYSAILEAAIKRASRAGILFVAAAGNENNDNDVNPTYPASYDVPNVISVAAIDNKGQRASFSSYGAQKVHVAAPGVNILSTTPEGLKSWSGTSMATPHVSGVAALLKSAFPMMTATEIKNRILKTARPLASLRGKVSTGGMVDAFYALTNQIAPADANDPFHWEKQAYNLETTHPYKEDFEATWKITVPGAKKLAVHFERFETEARYDIVSVSDGNGQVFANISGKNSETFSPTVDGDTIVLRLKSDYAESLYGFKIDGVAVQK